MFQSYQYIKNLGYDLNTDKHNWLIKIIDTDFEEEVRASTALVAAAGTAAAVAAAAIQVYSQRKLNVASNLFLLMEYVQSKYKWSINNQIIWFQQYIPEYKPYHSEVEKLLCLV